MLLCLSPLQLSLPSARWPTRLQCHAPARDGEKSWQLLIAARLEAGRL